MVLPEHADHTCRCGVLLDEGGEQQRVFSPVMAVESETEAVAVEQEISRGVCDIRTFSGGPLRGAECETKSFVGLEKLPSPCDEPRDVAHDDVGTSFQCDRLLRAPS